MNDFYMVLVSNTPSIANNYQRIENVKDLNKISEFTTQLPHSIYLGDEEWECALSDFSYYHSYYNIEGENAYIIVQKSENFLPIEENNDIHTNFQIHENECKIILKDGNLIDGKEIEDILNIALKKIGCQSFFTFSRYTNKISLTVKNEMIQLSTFLGNMLGFDNLLGNGKQTIGFIHDERHVAIGRNSNIFVPRNSLDFNIKTHNMFIYCDILQNTLVGGYYHPLLAVIPTKEQNYYMYITKSFTNRHYISLNTKVLSRIKINIKDDQDENIKFNAGRTLLKLHFRPKS